MWDWMDAFLTDCWVWLTGLIAGWRVSFDPLGLDLEQVNLLRRDAQAADLDELAGLVRLDTRRLSIFLHVALNAICDLWMVDGVRFNDWVSV
jgi:hypothetical protein